MREFYLIASVIVPIFLMMLLGYYIAKTKVVSPASAKQLNSMTFKYLLPTQLFLNIYTSSLDEAVNPKLMAIAVTGIVLAYLLLEVILPKLFPERKKYVPMIHAMYRSNYVIFGLVVVAGFYPEQLAVPSVMAAIVIPLYAILGVILLEKGGSEKTNLKKTLINILKNPLLVSAVLGLIANAVGLAIPAILMKFLKDVASIANPLALLAIGMGFEFSSIHGNVRPVATVTMWRLLIFPLIMMGIGILMGLKNVELMTLLIIFGSPVAVSSYTLSLPYDVDHSLANLLVISTTLACLVTLFVLLMIFSHTPFMQF